MDPETMSQSNTDSVSGSSSHDEDDENESKLMTVTVTVLSLSGIIARDASMNSKLKEKAKNLSSSMRSKPDKSGKFKDSVIDADTTDATPIKNCNPRSTHPTSIVASFVHDVSNNQRSSFLTHFPSLPMSLPSSPSNEPFEEVIHWPTTQPYGENATHDDGALSTLKFQRHFLLEKDCGDKGADGGFLPSATYRFVPQSCPIELSLSRDGKLVVIGAANILVSGEEVGGSSTNIPVVNPLRSKSPTKRLRKKLTAVPMLRLKGDSFRCGITPEATLRVLVHVEEAMSTLIVDGADDNPAADTPCDIGTHCDSVEEWEDYDLDRSELRTLREQLAQSEKTNNDLLCQLANQREIAEAKNFNLLEKLKAMKKANNTAFMLPPLEEEPPVLLALATLTKERDIAQANNKELLRELSKAQKIEQLLPIYEDRIKEMVNELTQKDAEIQFMQDELVDVKSKFRVQADAKHWDPLLWDTDPISRA